MERRTQKGADAYAKCEALKRWLKDFSRLKERPVLDIKVWGEFLVYAYLFGIADEVIDELRDSVPEMFTEDATLAASSYYAVSYTHLETPDQRRSRTPLGIERYILRNRRW